MSDIFTPIPSGTTVSPGQNRLSKFWGTDDAVTNIIGLILVTLIVANILYTFLIYPVVASLKPELAGLGLLKPIQLWNLLIPFMATSFGIMIGKHSK